MPYNPGVVDISGQLRAQGRLAGAQSIGQGIQNFSEQYAKYQEENDLLKAKTKAFEDMIKTNAQLFGLNDPEKLKAFTDQSPNESLRQKNARLGQFMEATMTQKVMEKGQRDAAAQEQQRRIGEMQLRAGQQAMEQNQFIQTERQRAAAQEETNRKALQGAFQPRTQIQSQTGDAIGAGATFEDLQNFGVPTTAPVRTTTTPTFAEAARTYAVSQGEPTPAITQFLNAGMDSQNAQGATAQRAAKAESDLVHQKKLADLATAKAEVARHPLIAAIDASVEAGEITVQEGKDYKKEIFKKGGEFSPNGLSAIAALLGLGGDTASNNGVSPTTFATAADAAAARKANKIKDGQKIIVGGKSATWRD